MLFRILTVIVPTEDRAAVPQRKNTFRKMGWLGVPNIKTFYLVNYLIKEEGGMDSKITAKSVEVRAEKEV